MFSYTNSSNTTIDIKLNDAATLLEGIYIYDEYGNLISMFELTYGENSEILGMIDEINSKLEFEIKPVIAKYVAQHEMIYNAFYDVFNDISSKNVNVVGFEAFKNCKKLDDVNFNDTLTELSKHAFNSCSNLGSITLPESLVIVGENCFSKCTKLREITILGNNTILKSAFSGISAVTIDLDNPTPQDSHIFFVVPKENTELLNKFTSVSFVNEIGITGLDGDEVYITIYLNGVEGIINEDLIEYKEK